MSDQKQLGNKGGSALQSKKAKSKQKAVLASHYPVRKNFWDSIRPSPGSRKFLAYVAKRDKEFAECVKYNFDGLLTNEKLTGTTWIQATAENDPYLKTLRTTVINCLIP